jgi:hypothetical protein
MAREIKNSQVWGREQTDNMPASQKALFLKKIIDKILNSAIIE